ncbi:hypothetical protein, partial [Falsiroseomonas oryzae]|uniref:hypothetical protein n=1 Tax=Falsiroseomonas oryzae TaxID=2766473 RepID=UPI0022EB6387
MPDTVVEPALRPVTPAASPTPVAIRGAVDVVGAERIYGWVWRPDRPGERLRVEARLDGLVLQEVRADFARKDLQPAGIGDGNHAFEMRLPAECVARKSELAIVAISEDGTEQKLNFRVPRAQTVTAVQSRREIETLAAGQKELREELRAAIAQLSRAQRGGGGEGGAAAMQVATVQARLEERLGTLDIWLTRLDARLAALAEAKAAERPRRRVDAWQLVLGAVLALAGGR